MRILILFTFLFQYFDTIAQNLTFQVKAESSSFYDRRLLKTVNVELRKHKKEITDTVMVCFANNIFRGHFAYIFLKSKKVNSIILFTHGNSGSKSMVKYKLNISKVLVPKLYNIYTLLNDSSFVKDDLDVFISHKIGYLFYLSTGKNYSKQIWLWETVFMKDKEQNFQFINDVYYMRRLFYNKTNEASEFVIKREFITVE